MDSRTGKWDTGEKAQHIRDTSPFGDYDRDGVLNAADCQPFNPYEHGFWGDAWSAVRQRVAAPIYQRVYTPYVQAQIQRVSTGVSAAGATAQRYVQRYKPTASYEVAAERRRKVVEKIKKIKKRIPEKERIARAIIRTSPKGIIAMGVMKRMPDIKERVVPLAKRVFEFEKRTSPAYIASGIITKKGKEAWGWKPKTEREFESQMQSYTESVASYERTPEGGLILPTKLTPEVQTWKRQKEVLTSEAERKGWVTDSKIMYPPTPEGEAWAGKYEQVAEQGEKYITPEGYVKPEYVVHTEESKAIIAQQETLAKRAEQLSDPLYMAKERTEGMRMAPVVTKAHEFGDWWGKTVTPKVDQFTELSKGVYAMQAERGMPSIFMGTMLFPKEQPIIPTLQKGMVKGVPDIPIMAAEVGYAGEYVFEDPKEAAMIAPGVAAYMARGMAKEAVTHPVEFTGRMITMAAVTGGIGKAIRPVMPKYISGVKPTEAGVITYKGLGIRGIKEPRPMIGVWKETVRTPDIVGMQKALVLGKKYPAIRYVKGVREAEIPMPELGLGARAFGKQTYTEMGVGRAIKYERMRMEGLWGKDYFLPERMAGVPEPAAIPKFKALPPPKPVLWERVGPTTLAKRVTAVAKTKQPKPIREWGVRIEKPIIPTYTELAKGRAYQITKGYDAFQIGQYPTHLKMLGLGKGVPKFAKGIEEMIHPFRKKVPHTYEPSMLDYQAPRGLLTEGLRLDMTRAKIRHTERPPSPIEKLYERVTAEDIFRDFGIERRPAVGMKPVLKPIETRYLKFTPEGELIPQPEITISKPKRKIEVATMPKTSFDFKVMTDEAIKIATDTRLSTKSIIERTAKEAKRAREAGKEGIGKIEAFGKMPINKKVSIGFPIIEGIPSYIPGRAEKEKAVGFVIPGYEAAFKPHPIEAITPKEKQREKERTAAFIMPKIQPAIELGFETAPKAEPITEFGYKPIKPPPPIITTFAEPPIIPFAISFDDDKKKPRIKKKRKHKEREWYERHYIPTVQELMRTPKGVGVMTPEMPPLPEIHVPKL